MKPQAPLRYLGSKWRMAPRICAHLPDHECYVEPFSGSAAVLLTKQPSRIEVYNDIDEEVVHFFRVLREHTDALIEAVSLTPVSRREHDLAQEPADDPVERARRFLIRSWQTRGGYHGKSSGQSWWYMRGRGRCHTSVQRWSKLPDRLAVVADRLIGVHIECEPWQSVIDRYDAPQTLFYLDPPYLGATRSISSGYEHDMRSEDDHRDLLETLTRIDGMAVVSGYDSDLYQAHLGAWTCLRKNQLTGAATYRTECLWLSPGVSALQGRLAL